jgi:hypothetical protein
VGFGFEFAETVDGRHGHDGVADPVRRTDKEPVGPRECPSLHDSRRFCRARCPVSFRGIAPLLCDSQTARYLNDRHRALQRHVCNL